MKINSLLAIFFCSVSIHSAVGQSSQKPISSKKPDGNGQIVNGLREGVWEFFYPDGKLMAREHYEAGDLQGKAENFYPNGQRASLEFWKDDLQEDSAYYYHSSGVLHRKGRYESGVYQGVWFTWFANGKPEQRIAYVDGLPDGESQNWSEAGVLIETGHYRFGKKEGQFIFFDPKSGRITGISTYTADLPSGLWLYFNRREKIIRKEWH